MSRFVEFFRRDGGAIRAILVVLSVVIMAFGAYAIGPWYVGGPTTSFGAVLESDLIRAIPTGFYIISGLYALTGCVFNKFDERLHARYWGSFLITVGFTFMTALRLFTFGFTPVVWLLSLGLGLISAIIFLWESGREDKI